MRQDGSLTRVLLIWLTPQLLSLLLSALRVPLSAHPPRPIESVAAVQMAIVQIIIAALFAPLLFRSAAGVVAVILSAAPMLQLAAFLSATPTGKTIALYQLGASWALAVGAVCAVVSARQRLMVAAVSASWAVGGLVLAYLHGEFAPQRPLPAILFGPALAAAHTDGVASASPTYWVFLGLFITLGVVTTCAALLRSRATPPPI